MSIIEQFCAFYNDLKKSQITDIKQIYSSDIVLIDPIGTHRGLAQLTDYFEKLLHGAKHCDFSITSVAEHKTNELAEETHYSVNWVMSFATPKLNAGRNIDVDGMTLLKIRNNKIYYHRDYYDLGQMVYEHVPLLGAITKKIKHGMRA
jgi:limonene-1,2-epoxide hydrolase